MLRRPDEGHSQKIYQGGTYSHEPPINELGYKELVGLPGREVGAEQAPYQMVGEVRHRPSLGGANVGVGGIVRAHQLMPRHIVEQLKHPLGRSGNHDVGRDPDLVRVEPHGGHVHTLDIPLCTENLHPAPALSRDTRKTMKGVEQTQAPGGGVLVGHEGHNATDRPTKVGHDVAEQLLNLQRIRRGAPNLKHCPKAHFTALRLGTEGIVGGLSLELLVIEGDRESARHF
jgi:hypothetical protein